MVIYDAHGFLTEKAIERIRHTLEKHKIDPELFSIEVSEDQSSMDMNDLNYRVMLKIKIQNNNNSLGREYLTPAECDVWIDSFDSDLSRQ